MRTRLRNSVVGLLALCLVSCGGSHPQITSTAPKVTVATPQRESISQIVSGEAELFPYKQASLSPKISSPIHKFFVHRGDHVHKGELLVELENRDLAANLGQAQGAYAQAQANYTATTSATLPQQLQKAQAAVADAKSNLEAQQKLYDNRKMLYAQGAIAGKNLDQASVALTNARSKYNTALKQLRDLRRVTAAQTAKLAKGQLQTARAKKQAAAVQLQYSKLRSPINGVVAYRNLYPGDIAPAGTPVLIVMNVSKVIAKLHLPQDKSALLKIGDPATLTVSGINQTFPGQVSVLSPALDPNSTTSEVWVEAPNPNGELKPGESASVSIVANTIHNALVVPSSAIVTTNSGKNAVMVVQSDNTVQRQDVRLGIENNNKVQVVSGLHAGQEIVSNGAYGLPNGTKIKPVQSTQQAKNGAAQSQ